MRSAVLPLLYLLVACGDADSKAPAAPTAIAAHNPCNQQIFEDDRFTVCDAGGGRIELAAAARNETPVRRFADLESKLGARAGRVAFAMNAGMYGEDGRPIGLAIVEGRQVRAINRRKGGGNFHLMPNGVFQVRGDGRSEIVTTADWKPSPDTRIATQSGPMLVIGGKLHPAFDHDGSSRHIRNGVGIAPDGRPLFVISEDPVSLGKFARFFRDRLKCRDALFFDGAVSALWDPANHRRDVTVPLGPILVAFKPGTFRPEASKPGPEGRATP
ncbi:phosphodiester glycosidase family protein [Sphingomonas sp.]|uniref:phosphodiester glycosidase family protein n=1 Tax=Sphingomonas sp. TaxID=28214 RepID=UPI001837BADA|nr:phosphodiester glycosidase family protein [Sphingomonas sp.]MBA3511482.1 phosphodiester glycosidase family protein [Sphingomonas sp.]